MPPRVEKPRFTVTGSGIRVQTAVEREIQEKAKRELDDRTWNTRLDARSAGSMLIRRPKTWRSAGSWTWRL